MTISAFQLPLPASHRCTCCRQPRTGGGCKRPIGKIPLSFTPVSSALSYNFVSSKYCTGTNLPYTLYVIRGNKALRFSTENLNSHYTSSYAYTHTHNNTTDHILLAEAESSSVSFEPVLDVGAFGSFLVVFCIFVFLQLRISAIGKAADRRTETLEELRDVKSRQLSGQEGITDDDVLRATENYRHAYEKVEALRTVIPGIARIPPPPADTLSRDRMQDNEAAAQQFLGIQMEESQSVKEGGGGLAPPLIAVLVLVAVSQIVLLGFLSLDPMDANSALDTVGSVMST